MNKETLFYGNIENYTNDDFVALVENKHGWAVAEQAQDILNGEAYDKQNHNALALIRDFAYSKGECELAESIDIYLNYSEE
jgi:hypothetical protein